ncbi:adenylosuccinate lyase [Aliiroseovarius sp. PTFE2010]
MKYLFAIILTALPSITYAACSGHPEQVSSCAEGHIWDGTAGACVVQVGT